MTAEQKAKDLVEKMYVKYEPKIEDKGGIYYFNMSFDISKQCALIAVDEMLDFRNGLYMNEGSIVHQYLMDIKQEIEKL